MRNSRSSTERSTFPPTRRWSGKGFRNSSWRRRTRSRRDFPDNSTARENLPATGRRPFAPSTRQGRSRRAASLGRGYSRGGFFVSERGRGTTNAKRPHEKGIGADAPPGALLRRRGSAGGDGKAVHRRGDLLHRSGPRPRRDAGAGARRRERRASRRRIPPALRGAGGVRRDRGGGPGGGLPPPPPGTD